MKLQTKLLIASNILLLAFAGWLLYRGNYFSKIYHAMNDVKEDHKAITYSFERDKLFEALPMDTNSIVFIGSSLTQQYELADFFHNVDVKNRGITGDITEGVLQRLDAIIKAKPKKIFIEIGINDVFMKLPNDTILSNYHKIINKLMTGCPRTQIYVQSLFPVSNNSTMLKDYNTTEINQHINDINNQLDVYIKNQRPASAAGQKLTYIDTHSKFKLNNALNKDYTLDGVHLSVKGYFLWTDILKPFVEE